MLSLHIHLGGRKREREREGKSWGREDQQLTQIPTLKGHGCGTAPLASLIRNLLGPLMPAGLKGCTSDGTFLNNISSGKKSEKLYLVTNIPGRITLEKVLKIPNSTPYTQIQESVSSCVSLVTWPLLQVLLFKVSSSNKPQVSPALS